MIPIEIQGTVNWAEIRAEYIAGGVSYRKLAEKHGISKDIIAKKAGQQNWQKDRAKANDKATEKIIQRTASAIAENAEIAADIKKQLLLRLQRIEKKYPLDATEVRTRQGNSTAIYRIRDLTAAYKDLTSDMPTAENPGANAVDNSLIEAIKQSVSGLQFKADIPEGVGNEDEEE